MDKLELNLDDLHVESFSAGSQNEDEKGTVRGQVPYTWQDIPECHETIDVPFCTEPADRCPAY